MRYYQTNRKKYAVTSLSLFILGLVLIFTPLKTSLAESSVARNINSMVEGTKFTPDISTIKTPQNPEPLSSLTISLNSPLVSLRSDLIRWYKNGVLQKKGVGERDFTFTTGEEGKKDIIKTVIVDEKFGELTKTTVIAPGSVDILWEAQNYTPPFYRGKKLASSQSTVKFVAIPHIKGASAGSLTYKWKKGHIRMGGAQGFGVRTAKVILGYLQTTNIGVEVSSPDGSEAASDIRVESINPEIHFYPKNDELGVLYNQELLNETQIKSGDLLSLIAEPFFFSLSDKNNNDAKYEWRLNGKKTEPDTKKSSFSVRAPKEGSGRASIGLRIMSRDHLLQSANGVVRFSF